MRAHADGKHSAPAADASWFLSAWRLSGHYSILSTKTILVAKETCDASSSKIPRPRLTYHRKEPLAPNYGRAAKECVIDGERFDFIAGKDKRKFSQSK